MGAVLRQGPAVDRHAQHLRASVPEFGDQLLVGNAVLQDRHSQALDGGLCVERGAVSADAAQFLKHVMRPFASTLVVTHDRSSNCGHAPRTFR